MEKIFIVAPISMQKKDVVQTERKKMMRIGTTKKCQKCVRARERNGDEEERKKSGKAHYMKYKNSNWN